SLPDALPILHFEYLKLIPEKDRDIIRFEKP
ncbi:MAG: hypothetical protein PWQ52_1201, partial [Methanolobus sp.]|nr:hypothetical protein [Methanolobus sp.]